MNTITLLSIAFTCFFAGWSLSSLFHAHSSSLLSPTLSTVEIRSHQREDHLPRFAMTPTSAKTTASSSQSGVLSLAATTSIPPPAARSEPAFVSDLLKRLNYKTSVQDIRDGAGLHDLFNPDYEAIFYGHKRTHPTARVIIDVGPYDGMDIAYPAYQRGYTVVSFELNPKCLTGILKNWKNKGLVEGTDFDVIRGPFPLAEPLLGYVGKDDKPHLYIVAAGASDETLSVSVSGSSQVSQVKKINTGAKTSNMNTNNTTWTKKKAHQPVAGSWVTRVDEVVSKDANIFLLKTDAEGHDGKALMGSSKLLNQTYTIALEFRPSAMREQDSDPVELLQWLWDNDFQCYDMNTHPGYVPNPPFKAGLARPSAIADFVAWLEHVPRGVGPKGDALGGWEDLICSRRKWEEELV